MVAPARAAEDTLRRLYRSAHVIATPQTDDRLISLLQSSRRRGQHRGR